MPSGGMLSPALTEAVTLSLERAWQKPFSGRPECARVRACACGLLLSLTLTPALERALASLVAQRLRGPACGSFSEAPTEDTAHLSLREGAKPASPCLAPRRPVSWSDSLWRDLPCSGVRAAPISSCSEGPGRGRSRARLPWGTPP